MRLLCQENITRIMAQQYVKTEMVSASKAILGEIIMIYVTYKINDTGHDG